jgi:hypothetical protein
MNAHEITRELTRRGVSLRAEGDRIIAKPLSAVPLGLREAARAAKPQLLALLASQSVADAKPGTFAANDPAAEALTVLARLKGYTIQSGRMPAARAIVERLRHLLTTPELDATAVLTSLQAVETELTALGGASDVGLADVIGLVDGAFPGARLIEVKKLLQ